MTAEPGTRVLQADPPAIAAAARCLAAGGLVAFPTETVYGLGADAGNGEAVARLYAAKGRPAFNPLIAHVGGAAAARRLGALRCRRREAGRRVLAGAADAGAAEAAGLRGRRSRARRARQRGGARAGAPGRAGAARGVRRAGGGAVGQPLRPRLADQRRACARRPARPHRHGDRRRALPGRRRSRPSSPASASRRCCGPAGCRARRSSACSGSALARRRHATTRRRSRPACWPRIMRRRRGCGSTPRRRATGEALLAFGPARRRRTLNLSPRGDLIEAAANLFSHLRALDASGASASRS